MAQIIGKFTHEPFNSVNSAIFASTLLLTNISDNRRITDDYEVRQNNEYAILNWSSRDAVNLYVAGEFGYISHFDIMPLILVSGIAPAVKSPTMQINYNRAKLILGAKGKD